MSIFVLESHCIKAQFYEVKMFICDKGIRCLDCPIIDANADHCAQKMIIALKKLQFE